MKEQVQNTEIAEEVFMIEHSGEIPEVALHSSLYYLTEDPDGPALKLGDEDMDVLKQAVVRRYRTIIKRDLNPQNRDKRMYRGLARCSVNWQRLVKFCLREKIDFEPYQDETAEALQAFLEQELADVQSGNRSSCINCCSGEVKNLAGLLNLSPADFPADWHKLCSQDSS
jgi:hypothetical protein